LKEVLAILIRKQVSSPAVNNEDYYYEGYCSDVVVWDFDEADEDYESKVLGLDGKPIAYYKRNKMGFDLQPKHT
jgi:hypothetical protein